MMPTRTCVTSAPPPYQRRLDHGQNFGAVTASVAAGDLLINAAEHVPGTVVPRHDHANAYVCVVMKGSFEIRGRERLECPPGSIITYPAGDAHSNRFGAEPGRCINIHFGPAWSDEPSVRRWLADRRHLRVDTAARPLMRLGREMQAGDSAAPLAAASAAIELVALAMRTNAPAPHARWFAQIIDMIEADLAHAPTLGQVASAIGAHPAHVSRVFRQTRGETIGAYVRRRRVEEAERALATGVRSLAEIAASAGFSDQAHFTRVFRRHFGVTPGARRRQCNSCSTSKRNVQDDPPHQR